MLKNYLKIALRTIFKHKLFSFINLFGLALSLSFCMLVIVIINDQSSFDQFHPRENDIYRIITNAQRKAGGAESYASSPMPLGKLLSEESAAVEKVVSLTRGLHGDAKAGETTLSISGFFTDHNFFEVFGFQLARGNPQFALREPNALVLSTDMAARFFGDADPVGETITIANLADFVVTGVLAPPQGKTHIEFDALASSELLAVLEKEGRIRPVLTDWKNYYGTYNYVRLHDPQKAAEVSALLSSLNDRIYRTMELESRDKGYDFELQALADITPGPHYSNNLGNAMPDVILIFLSVLAAIGMVAALFNYTNLSMARSLGRAKEVGIRKVTGAVRTQVFVQFLGESVVTALLSLFLALVLLLLVLIPGFQQLQLAHEMSIDFGIDAKVLTLFVGFAVLTGLIAGLLPAGVISAFRPVQVISGLAKVRVFSKITLRKALIVFQFALSITLMIIVTTVYKQIDYALRMDYGFSWDNLINIDLQGNDPALLAQALVSHPEVVGYSLSSHNMGTWEDSSIDVRRTQADEPVGVRDYSVDARFAEQFELSVIAGANFDATLGDGNLGRVLVNERFLQRFELGAAHDAVGASLILGDSTQVLVSGVVKDFLYKPVTYDLEPMLIRYDPAQWNVVNLKIHGANIEGIVAHLENTWKKVDPVHAVSWRFYDALLEDVYRSFKDIMMMIAFLAALALTISLLGLLGIATFNAESRIKEVGVRKVLGADLQKLVLLLSKNDLLLMLIATAIAVPLSVWLVGMLLQSFAYRIDVGPGIILPGVLSVFALSGLTIGWQAVKAALVNPVRALRYE